MSVSDPLIREIKEWTSKFLENYNINVPITDANVNLQPFCCCVEKIFTKGLIPQYNSLGIAKQLHPWCWIEKIKLNGNDSSTFNFTNALYSVRNCKTVLSSTGRLRLLIRTCLTKKCLHIPILTLAQNVSIRMLYNPNEGILGDEILVQILLSVLLQYSKFTFKLDVTNSSFLDLSWILPKVVTMELVPCKFVGISVSFCNEKAVIVNVDSNSVAAEDGNIDTGDVLDELNGMHLSLSSRGKLNKIRNKYLRKPVSLKVIKVRYTDKGDLYPPLIPLLKLVKIDPDTLRDNFSMKMKNSIKNVTTSSGYPVTYVGFVSTGSTGDVKEIDRAIKIMLRTHHHKDKNDKNEFGPRLEKIKKTVNFEIGEIGVKVIATEKGDVILNHSYMVISSCGTVSSLKHYFAYIAGEQICNLAKNFTCYIFHSKCDEHIFTILQSIGQGFQRTHYAV